MSGGDEHERGQFQPLSAAPYDLYRHRHNFSVWAAARAAQRRLTTVDNLRAALEHSDVVRFIRDHGGDEINADAFAAKHRIWCDSIVEYLTRAGVQNVKFGRAAKLVAVYIKSMVVIGPLAGSSLARVAHPPIDRILLQNLSRIQISDASVRTKFRTTNWTDLDCHQYYALIEMIRKSFPDLGEFWRLEEHWTVTQASDD
jgi:hypothetical protein